MSTGKLNKLIAFVSYRTQNQTVSIYCDIAHSWILFRMYLSFLPQLHFEVKESTYGRKGIIEECGEHIALCIVKSMCLHMIVYFWRLSEEIMLGVASFGSRERNFKFRLIFFSIVQRLWKVSFLLIKVNFGFKNTSLDFVTVLSLDDTMILRSVSPGFLLLFLQSLLRMRGTAFMYLVKRAGIVHPSSRSSSTVGFCWAFGKMPRDKTWAHFCWYHD